MNRASVLLTICAFTSAITLCGCSGSSSTPVPRITVSVTSDTTAVPAGGTANLTATVSQDPSSRGVTWKVSCSVSQCGTVAPGSTPSGTPASYTSPSTPPANDLAITITATSVADPSSSNAVTITVSAVSVSATPSAAAVQAGTSLYLSAVVNNDISGQGVSWSISPASGLGTLVSATNADVTYTGPATPPTSDASVTITATSLVDATKSSAVTITIPSVTIAVSPSPVSIPAASTVPNITATVGNDPAHKGVNWTVSCAAAPCGTVSSTATGSGVAIIYTAPSTPPASDLPVNVTATSVADPAAATTLTITVLAITVSVSAPTTNVAFADTVPNIVATVGNDPSGKGVTWSIEPCGAAQCGSISAQSASSGGAITYTAPSSPVPSDLSVNLVATSISDTSKSNVAGITVLAITVSVTPATGIIPVNATTQLNATEFTGTPANDSSNQGVTWTLMQGATPAPCSPTCGTVTPNPANNAAAVYAAPTTLPADTSVSIIATSVTDPSKTGSATITLGPGTVKLIPSSLSFGTLKVSSTIHPKKTLSVQFTNSGGSALNITGQTVSGPYTVSTPCSATLNSGGTCAIGVTFAPTVAGNFTSSLTVADNDVASPQLVPLLGRACATRICFGLAIQDALVTDRLVTAPIPSGPNKVGTRTLDLVDADRSDPYLNHGQRRELMVRFWYPTTRSGACKPASYAEPAVWNYMAQLVKVTPPHVRTNSCQDAPIAAGAHPVVVFTHGYSGTFTDYTFLFEDLASRGYVVASVGHTFESTAVQFPDGRLVKSMLGTHLARNLQMNEPATTLAVVVRLSDLKFVMNELGRLNDQPRGLFTGALDLSRVALSGHSLGGMTALLGVELESRFRAAISLDGVMPSTWFNATRKPVMLLASGGDLWQENTCHVWSQLHGPRFALNLKDSEHITPSDAIWLTNGGIKTSGGMQKTVAAVRNYVAAFLDANMNVKTVDGLLTGPSPDYPEIEVTTSQSQTQCGVAPSNAPR